MSAIPVFDAAALPRVRIDHRALIWWGILGMIAIEGTLFLLAFATYFYLGAHSQAWPPLPWPRPPLLIPTVNAAVLLLSCVPNAFMDRAAEKNQRRRLVAAMVAELVLALAAIVLRGEELATLPYRWNSNAYSSCVWSILVLHSSHLVASTFETVVLLVLVVRGGLLKRHLLDIRVDGLYWYFVVAAGVASWLVCDVAPRLT